MKPPLRAWTDYVGRDCSGEEPDWLRGQRLAEAERWLESRGTDLRPDLRKLIEDSRRVRDREAKRERQAEALRLAAHSEQAMRTALPAPDIALAIAVESILTEPTVQGDVAIRRVLRLHPRTLVRFDHDRRVTSVAFSPAGTRIATGSTDGHARVLRPGHGREAGPAAPGRSSDLGGVQPGWHPGSHWQLGPLGPGPRRGHRGGKGTAEPRWPGARGGVQPGRRLGGPPAAPTRRPGSSRPRPVPSCSAPSARWTGR